MSFARWLQRIEFVPEPKRLEWYPPFWFMGVKIRSVAPDFTHLHAHIPLRWYFKNMHGSMFGGFMCAVADPLPALLCSKIFKGVQVWTKGLRVDFLKPARTGLDFHITIPDPAIETMRADLDSRGRASQDFQFDIVDARRRVVASVTNTVFVRRKITEGATR